MKQLIYSVSAVEESELVQQSTTWSGSVQLYTKPSYACFLLKLHEFKNNRSTFTAKQVELHGNVATVVAWQCKTPL